MSRTRICIVSHAGYGALTGGSGHIGGVERQTSFLAKWLAARGHAVDFVTWARALGLPAARVERPGELTRELLDELMAEGGPALSPARSCRVGPPLPRGDRSGKRLESGRPGRT